MMPKYQDSDVSTNKTDNEVASQWLNKEDDITEPEFFDKLYLVIKPSVFINVLSYQDSELLKIVSGSISVFSISSAAI